MACLSEAIAPPPKMPMSVKNVSTSISPKPNKSENTITNPEKRYVLNPLNIIL